MFVYIKDGLGNKYLFDMPAEPVELDQKGCHYTPHVVGVRAAQPLEIVNSDDTLHNVHGMPKANREFNQGQPVQGMKNDGHLHVARSADSASSATSTAG